MAYILHLETSTKQCSVALAFEGKPLVSRKLLSESFSHSEKLHLFISETLEEVDVTPSELNAIAVSKGPGSYTGLRIGVAAAKGLCFALDKPLIALNSLEILAQNPIEKGIDFIIPMIDARRMEVFTAVFNREREWVQKTNALILSPDSFKDVVHQKSCLVLGDGSQKFKALNPEINAQFSLNDEHPDALNMVQMAWEKYCLQDFESLAYFEPFYLKDFQTTPPKDKTGI